MGSAPPPFFKNNERYYQQGQNGGYKPDNMNNGNGMGGYSRNNAYKPRNDPNSGNMMRGNMGGMPASNGGPNADYRSNQGPRPTNSTRTGPPPTSAPPRSGTYGGGQHRGGSNPRSQQGVNA